MAERTGLPAALNSILQEAGVESPATLHDSLTGRMSRPARYGGDAKSPEQLVSAVCDLASLDGSLGWLAAMFNAAAAEVAGLPGNAAGEIWGADPNALVTAGYRGDGTLEGSRLSGRWDSVVGAEYADWLVLPARGDAPCRVLVPRSVARIEPIDNHTGLRAAGVCTVTVSESPVESRHCSRTVDDAGSVIAAAAAAAAVVGSADGVWRKHVDHVRARLATSYGGEEATDEAAAQVAWAASDVDAAKLQLTASAQPPYDLAAAIWACRQAVARACGAADRLLGNSRHALDASDPVTRLWRDAHAGARLARHMLDGLDH